MTQTNYADRVHAAEEIAHEIVLAVHEKYIAVNRDKSEGAALLRQDGPLRNDIAAIISRHITESDLYRAGVAACVARIKSMAVGGHTTWPEVAKQIISEIESITDSAASPVAAQQEVNSSAKCVDCGTPLGRSCSNCQRLWES